MAVIEDSFRQWLESGYPRPQLCRAHWCFLNGKWGFQEDPDDVGIRDQWFSLDNSSVFTETITVPFPPGSKLSGYQWHDARNDPSVVWYHRTLTAQELLTVQPGERCVIHFEAVDYSCDVWINGQHAGSHRGGYTPFSIDVTENAPCEIVLRVADSRDEAQPRGKQSWRAVPDGIWYERSTGIGRDVWLESRPRVAVEEVSWRSDLQHARLIGDIFLTEDPDPNARLSVRASLRGIEIADVSLSPRSRHVEVVVPIPQLKNAMDEREWLWSVQHPNLIDLSVSVRSAEGCDDVVSYAGLRSVEVSEDYIHINREPVYIRGVLDQGYWPDSFFTAPSPHALKNEVDLMKSLGFNMARVHERTPDRRYVAWADTLGLLLWAEFPSSYVFDDRAMVDFTTEWLNAVRRDRSAPSIITWLPFNESWGVPLIASDPQQRSFVEGIVSLTRALDNTRPISANDGWEQPSTDIVTTHDYAVTPEQLRTTYGSAEALLRTVNGIGPQGRRTSVESNWNFDQPVIVSEFGGIALSSEELDQWGYRTVHSQRDFEEALRGLVVALLESPFIAGFCYTQLTDTAQEVNGLCTAERTPKLPVDTIRAIITSTDQHDRHVRPRTVTDDAMGDATAACADQPRALPLVP